MKIIKLSDKYKYGAALLIATMLTACSEDSDDKKPLSIDSFDSDNIQFTLNCTWSKDSSSNVKIIDFGDNFISIKHYPNTEFYPEIYPIYSYGRIEKSAEKYKYYVTFDANNNDDEFSRTYGLFDVSRDTLAMVNGGDNYRCTVLSKKSDATYNQTMSEINKWREGIQRKEDAKKRISELKQKANQI